MDDTSEERAAFEHLAGAPALPGDRVLQALELEFAAAKPAPRSLWDKVSFPALRSRQARVWTSLGLGALVLAATSLAGLQLAEVPVMLTALAGGLGLCALFLPSAVPGPTRASRTSRLVSMGVVAVLTLAYLGLTIAEFDPLSIVLARVPWSRVVACGLHVALAGGLCLAALLWPWRKSDPFSPMLLGAVLGALAGYASMLSVDASCASTEGFHVILGHASAVAIFGVLGALLGRRWLSP